MKKPAAPAEIPLDSHLYREGWWTLPRMAAVLRVHQQHLTLGVFGAQERIQLAKELAERYNKRDVLTEKRITEITIVGWIMGAVNGWTRETTTDVGRAAILEAAAALRCKARFLAELPKDEAPSKAAAKMDEEEEIPLDPEQSDVK